MNYILLDIVQNAVFPGHRAAGLSFLSKIIFRPAHHKF